MDAYYASVDSVLGGQSLHQATQSAPELVASLNAAGAGWREGEERRRERTFDDIVNRTAAKERVHIRANTGSSGKATGKVLFASRDFEQGDLVFEDTPLVAMQNVVSKQDFNCIGCDRCLKCLGNYAKVARSRQCEGVGEGENNDNNINNVFRCRCDCGVFYCSRECEEQAWKEYHHMICTTRQPLGASASSSVGGTQLKQEFNLHAEETNDIFKLAAKLYAMLLKRVVGQRGCDAKHQLEADAGGEAKVNESPPPTSSSSRSKQKGKVSQTSTTSPSSSSATALLDEAIKYAWKAPWYMSVAVPPDVEDKEGFRQQFKELASDSFALLRHSLIEDFPCLKEKDSKGDGSSDLFDLELFENLVGMFELNNLGVFGAEGGCSIEGTGFYPIHSCMNHSCDPNCVVLFFSPEEVAKMNEMSGEDEDCEEEDEEDKDKEEDETKSSNEEGAAHTMSSRCFVYALRDIAKGEEITCSYLDAEDLELDTESRNELLEDYCFRCTCHLCE